MVILFFFFNDTATTEIYTLSLHDALPICLLQPVEVEHDDGRRPPALDPSVCVGERHLPRAPVPDAGQRIDERLRSEEHTSELQSRQYLVCRLLLEKKNK